MPNVRLITERPLSRFTDLLQAKRKSLYRLWIVSPWIGEDEEDECVVDRLATIVSSKRTDLFVITRKPEHDWHSKAVARLHALKNVQVWTCPSLHTKLYIAECDDFKAALLGSPNLTAGGNRTNKELSVEFRAVMGGNAKDVEFLLRDLITYASELRGLSGVTILSKGD